MDWTLDPVGMSAFMIAGLWVLLRIDVRVTVLAFLPLVAVLVFTRIATTRLQRIRRESRRMTANVTGALGEMFASVRAVQVAGAEDRMTDHLRRLSDACRKAMVKARLYTQLIEAIVSNTVNRGTGIILLLVGGALGSSAFTVGDFALFVYYLGFVTDFPTFFGTWMAHYKQSAVSFDRMAEVMQGAPPDRLVAPAPLFFRGDPPGPEPLCRTEEDRLKELTVTDLT